VVKLFDDDGREVPPGQPGRIFAGSGLEFEGYTGGVEHKAMIDGLMSIGDVGYFDAEGRLFVGGRDDDMIVSGGENVFPREVADLLSDHPSIAEVAVIGVDDDAFGARLAAFVVVREGEVIDEESVKQHVRANLASYKVPRSVTFLDELPRNSTGKIRTKDLHEPR
jgi:fatty-acyl-CoA synthase